MAIIGPDDVPSILKVNSEPMKKYVLTKLGHPNVEVEITEDQWETLWRVAGDFISAYFPREQKLGLFWTTPLQSTYPLPEDAYWIQEVSWDPVTTRIDDVFGAESFLFCFSPELRILDKFGKLQYLDDWKRTWKAKTPYGDSTMLIQKHDNFRALPKIKIEYSGGMIEATSNHIIKSNEKWRELSEINIGDKLSGVKNMLDVQNISRSESTDAISLRANNSGCYYGCIKGKPILIH